MVLNPLAFDNQEEFEKALLEEGLKRGWTPIVVDNSMSQGALLVDDILAHISEQPWSSYTEADYSIEQWHAACLIHMHDGSPTSKTQCKLPVKTPNGTLNRNGVHAAAAALAGARSPLKASSEQKAKAANALRRYYSQLGETPPDSLTQSAIDDILEHFGTKGMKWGVRNSVHPDIADVPKKTRKEAAKDAEEFTRAKLYFGQGAGIRRRLINAKVEANKKRDPAYSKAFDHFVKQTNLAQRAQQARKQRKRTDRTSALKKNLRVASNIILEQSDASVGDIVLSHHGIKGMHWGQRRAERRTERSDRKFARKAQSLGGRIDLNNKAAEHFNANISKINNNPTYKAAAKAGKLNNENDPITKKYHKEVSNLYLEGLRKAAASTVSKSGNKTLSIATTGKPYEYDVVLKDVRHEDESIRVIFEHDEDGVITGAHFDQMSQAEMFIDDILTHHGVKGMKWGVRRKATVGAQEVIVSDKRKKIKTSGGQGHPAHPDAIKSRTTGQIAKKSGTKALSNAELKAFNERLNLEQNFKRLQYQDSSAGKKFVLSVMKKKGGPGIETVGKAAIKSPKVRAKVASGVAALALAV